MELNKIILEVLNKHGVNSITINNHSGVGKLYRQKLADELEKEVDKYCMTLMEAVACGTPPNNDYE